jgi:hypothetical protein
MIMKAKYWTLVVAIFQWVSSTAQNDVPLFSSKDPLNVQIAGSVKSIKKKTNDSTFVTGKFMYQDSVGGWVPVNGEARVRGNFRLENCYFPPLKINFNKKEVASTVFKGNKSLKLVFPCLVSAGKDALVRKEYLCYQFYQVLSPFHFRTRMANVSLTELSRKKPQTFDLLAFFVEDNSMVAKRANGKIMKVKGLSPAVFDENTSIRNDFFQYMIGNADWSAIYQHNANVMFANGKYITLSYDFDMSGFVNANYAQAKPPNLGTGDPRERVYRGYCKTPSAMEEVRKDFLAQEGVIHSIVEDQAAHFSKYEMEDMHNYLNGFFDILKSDSRFKSSILEACRRLQ